MENGPFEDAFPIENEDIPASYVRLLEGRIFGNSRPGFNPWLLPNGNPKRGNNQMADRVLGSKKINVKIYTPGSSNIAGWKMDPDWRCMNPVKNRDIPASYVSLPEGILLMAEILHHLGCMNQWNPINNGINYQPQLVSRISAINGTIIYGVSAQINSLILKDILGSPTFRYHGNLRYPQGHVYPQEIRP